MNPFESYGAIPVEQPSAPDTSHSKKTTRKRAAKEESALVSKNPESRRSSAEERLRTEARIFIMEALAQREEPITLDNYREVQEELLEKVRDSGLEHEDAEKQISAYVGNRVAALGEQRRLDLSVNPEKRRDVSQLDLAHSEWMQNAEDFVEAFRDNPEEIKNYWADFKTVFDKCSPELAKMSDTLKYGALAQVAAKGLMRELGDTLKKEFNVKADIRTEHSTAEEDIVDKVDFWTIVNLNHREKKIPCQVVYIDIGTSVTQDNKEGSNFVKENCVNFENPDLRNSRYGNQRVKDKINNFFKLNEKKYKISAFIALPKNRNVSILDNGTVIDAIRKVFVGNAVRSRRFWEEFIP